MNKTIQECTRKDFQALPWRDSYDTEIECDSLVIMPTRRKHDSGYLCMDFIAARKCIPICRCSGCSDILHIEGIGGYGKWRGSIPDLVKPQTWAIDCLPKSGLLHIFCRETILISDALSSLEIFSSGKRKGSNNGNSNS